VGGPGGSESLGEPPLSVLARASQKKTERGTAEKKDNRRFLARPPPPCSPKTRGRRSEVRKKKRRGDSRRSEDAGKKTTRRVLSPRIKLGGPGVSPAPRRSTSTTPPHASQARPLPVIRTRTSARRPLDSRTASPPAKDLTPSARPHLLVPHRTSADFANYPSPTAPHPNRFSPTLAPLLRCRSFLHRPDLASLASPSFITNSRWSRRS
jgi:hypothetical protein